MEPPGPERLAAAHGSLSPLQGLSSLLKPSSRDRMVMWHHRGATRSNKHRGEPEHIDKVTNLTTIQNIATQLPGIPIFGCSLLCVSFHC